MTEGRHPKPTTASDPRGWFARMDRGAAQILILAAIAIVLLVAALDHARGIMVPTLLALLASIALSPLARRIERLRAPASLAAAVIVAGLLVSSAAAIYTLSPSADAWNARAPQILREIENRARQVSFGISELVGRTRGTESVSPETTVPLAASPDEETAESETPDAGEDAIGKLVDGGQKLAADWAISAPGMVAGAVYWAVLTFFLLRDRAMLGRWVKGLGVGYSSRRALARAIQDVQSDVARYLLAITLINVALGICVAIVFHLMSVPNAVLWGALAGLLNFMPFIGAAIMALVTLGVGLVSFEDPLVALYLVGAVVVLSSIEGQLATPLIIGARLRLPTIGIFVAIAFGAWLWGAVGALVATPTLIVATTFFTRLNESRRANQHRPGDSRPKPSRQGQARPAWSEWPAP